MKLAIAAGAALAALAVGAAAFATERPRFDLDNDGWITRAEAATMADSVFARMDRNDDNKLDAADRRPSREGQARGDRRPAEGESNRGERGHRHHGPRGHGPAMMILGLGADEADANGDDALSLEEFRTLHLRFFDASDVNGDGRVKFDPPEFEHGPPPEPPAPPR